MNFFDNLPYWFFCLAIPFILSYYGGVVSVRFAKALAGWNEIPIMRIVYWLLLIWSLASILVHTLNVCGVIQTTITYESRSELVGIYLQMISYATASYLRLFVHQLQLNEGSSKSMKNGHHPNDKNTP